VSSALIVLPAARRHGREPGFRYAEWLPEATPWRDVWPGR
jgi:hypothetical protein